jgi:hypothetical protein
MQSAAAMMPRVAGAVSASSYRHPRRQQPTCLWLPPLLLAMAVALLSCCSRQCLAFITSPILLTDIPTTTLPGARIGIGVMLGGPVVGSLSSDNAARRALPALLPATRHETAALTSCACRAVCSRADSRLKFKALPSSRQSACDPHSAVTAALL